MSTLNLVQQHLLLDRAAYLLEHRDQLSEEEDEHLGNLREELWRAMDGDQRARLEKRWKKCLKKLRAAHGGSDRKKKSMRMFETPGVILVLTRATRSGKVNWVPSRDLDGFEAKIGSDRFLVVVYRKNDGSDTYLTVQFLNDQREIIDEMSIVKADLGPEHTSAYLQVSTLWQCARRSAMDADGALREVMEDLGLE